MSGFRPPEPPSAKPVGTGVRAHFSDTFSCPGWPAPSPPGTAGEAGPLVFG